MKRDIHRSSALRKGRYSELGQLYLVTSCTLNRECFFGDFYNARTVVKSLKYQDEIGRTDTYAYVVMPDHIHWLFALKTVTLGHAVGSVKSWVSKSLGRPVWQSDYHDRALRCEENLLQASRYIVANPLRAGLVENIGAYPHWDSVWLTGSMSM
jgi:REP element-mobilizing transposase RayT